MKEYEEKTIWTSDLVPLMASYNKGFLQKTLLISQKVPCDMLLILMILYHTIQNSGKMQHSLWVAEIIGSNHEDGGTSLTNADPIGVLPKRMSFRRIWQGKGAHKASSKVNFTYFDFPYSLFGII